MSEYKLSPTSIKRREGINLKLIEISDLAITLTLVDFGIPKHGGVREAQEQNNLFLDGFSKADGYEKISKHQRAEALDFYAFVNGHASWQHAHLAMVANAHIMAANMLGYKIKWGGLWKRKKPKIINGIVYGWDCAHIELA